MPHDQWIPHPSGDDVTVAFLRPTDLRDFKTQTVPVKWFVTKAEAFPANEKDRRYGGVMIGERCFMVGRFTTLSNEKRNAPAVRFGSVSMIPSAPITNETGFKQDSFLVEMHSIGGFSGSPVFVGNSNTFHGGMARLLGVDWGHIHVRRYVMKNGKRVRDEYVDVNSGAAAVVPAWKLQELLDGDDVTAIRRREEVQT